MVRQFLLPLLGLALLTTEAATAQKLPVAPKAAGTPLKDARTGRLLTARERRAAEAAAKKAQATQAASSTLAMTMPTQSTSWSGWSDEPVPVSDPVTHRPAMNVSVAPGMPLNQVGHGVTTDYNGRPLQRAASTTTLPTQR